VIAATAAQYSGVRDEIRENIRDLTSTLETAESEFTIGNDLAVLSGQLADVGNETVALLVPDIRSSDKEPSHEAVQLLLRSRINVNRLRFAALSASLDNVSKLADLLPSGARPTAEIKELRHSITMGLRLRYSSLGSENGSLIYGSMELIQDLKHHYLAHQVAWQNYAKPLRRHEGCKNLGTRMRIETLV
jgi:hypothetical protein